MPKVTIDYWNWEEAFDKFGFGDGDGPNFTDEVAGVVMAAGYEVDIQTWGMHNTMIMDVLRPTKVVKGRKTETVPISIIPKDVDVGYADPRKYLPKALVVALDKSFPSDTPYVQ